MRALVEMNIFQVLDLLNQLMRGVDIGLSFYRGHFMQIESACWVLSKVLKCLKHYFCECMALGLRLLNYTPFWDGGVNKLCILTLHNLSNTQLYR